MKWLIITIAAMPWVQNQKIGTDVK